MTSSYRPDTDYAKGLAIAMIESICILLIFLMFFPKVRDMISKELVIPEEKPATLTIDPSRTLPDTPPPADARQQQPQFMQTTAAQESPDTPKDPKFFSALNTVAASSSPGAKPTNDPNQAGEKTPALGFANSHQSAASDGSNNPQRQTQQQQQQSSRQQQAQPAQNPQQQQRQNQQQPPKPQESTRTPDKAQNQPTASPNQIKPLEKAPENPPPDIKQSRTHCNAETLHPGADEHRTRKWLNP
ncbi:hypothetical protein QQ056_10635 [Oscillatoria laete-virens NRMC-F 0139]|nr:hypothetical protein [Oscillatoria laete-virens]MDL5053998.1 hypothetical protein [Oscillatoria laete-virens NRMC-F 0139]